MLNRIANYIIDSKETCQECGITIDSCELADNCNCDITLIEENHQEICKKVSENPCVAEIYFDDGMFEVTFYIDYCSMVDEG